MKKISVIIAMLFAFTAVMAQEDIENDAVKSIELEPWSLGLNAGRNTGMHPMDKNAPPEFYVPEFVQLSGRYMFDDNWGIMASTQYNLFKIEDDVQTHYVGVLGNVVMELGNMMNFESFSKHLGLKMNIGVGAAAMWQPDRFSDDVTSRMFNQADEIITFNAGLAPYVKINENWAINLEYGFNYNIEQSRPFDMGEINEEPGLSAQFMTFSLGASYHFGEHSSKPFLLF
ncbi:MAG: outer membrane beta-barrel protein [Bacteroidota bacterium]|nr:outer membrane beta-barrel protein [Bacteroidota bacterium]